MPEIPIIETMRQTAEAMSKSMSKPTLFCPVCPVGARWADDWDGDQHPCDSCTLPGGLARRLDKQDRRLTALEEAMAETASQEEVDRLTSRVDALETESDDCDNTAAAIYKALSDHVTRIKALEVTGKNAINCRLIRRSQTDQFRRDHEERMLALEAEQKRQAEALRNLAGRCSDGFPEDHGEICDNIDNLLSTVDQISDRVFPICPDCGQRCVGPPNARLFDCGQKNEATAVGASAMSAPWFKCQRCGIQPRTLCLESGEILCDGCRFGDGFEPQPSEGAQPTEPEPVLPPVAPGSETFFQDADGVWWFLWPRSVEERLDVATPAERKQIAAVAIEEWWGPSATVPLRDRPPVAESNAATAKWRAWRDRKGD